MTQYSLGRKAAVLKKLLPPHNLSVAALARQEGISDVTLYTWRKQVKTSRSSSLSHVLFDLLGACCGSLAAAARQHH